MLSGDVSLLDPRAWRDDYAQNLAGRANQDRQLDLFYDYRTNIALYPAFQQYFRDSQVPLLAVWGANDAIFVKEGALAYKRDLPHAEVHLLEAGHFALETKVDDIARRMKIFLESVRF